MAAKWGASVVAVIALVAMSCAIVTEGVEVAGGACMEKTMNMDPRTFGEKSLGCAIRGVNDACCEEIKSLFGNGGQLESCMCEAEYYSLILESLPTEDGVAPESFVEQYNQCGVSTKGTQACGGGDPAPEVHAQVLLHALLAKKFLGKAFKKGFVKGAAVGAVKGAALAGGLGGYGGGYYYYYDYIDEGDDDDDDDDDDKGDNPPPAAAGATPRAATGGATAPRTPTTPRPPRPPGTPPATPPGTPPGTPPPGETNFFGNNNSPDPAPPAPPNPAETPQVTAQDGYDATAVYGYDYGPPSEYDYDEYQGQALPVETGSEYNPLPVDGTYEVDGGSTYLA